MINDERTIVKGLTVDSMTVSTIDACQDKNREIVPEQQAMLNICLFGNDTVISMLPPSLEKELLEV